MTLKNCLFLLNEKNYNKNFLFFRSEFKKLNVKNNDEFINELKDTQFIFSKLFNEYCLLYEKTRINNNNLNTPQSFRESYGDNLNKKFEAPKCINFGRNKEDLMKQLQLLSENLP